MRAAVQVTDAIEPLDHQRQEGKQPVEQDAVGFMVADVLDAVAVFGVVEPLVLNLPTLLAMWYSERPPTLRRGKLVSQSAWTTVPSGLRCR